MTIAARLATDGQGTIAVRQNPAGLTPGAWPADFSCVGRVVIPRLRLLEPTGPTLWIGVRSNLGRGAVSAAPASFSSRVFVKSAAATAVSISIRFTSAKVSRAAGAATSAVSFKLPVFNASVITSLCSFGKSNIGDNQ